MAKPPVLAAHLPAVALLDPLGFPDHIRTRADDLADAGTAAGWWGHSGHSHAPPRRPLPVSRLSDAVVLGLCQDLRPGQRNTPRRHILAPNLPLREPGARPAGGGVAGPDGPGARPVADPGVVSRRPGESRCGDDNAVRPLGAHGAGARR